MGWVLTVPKDYCEDAVDYIVKLLGSEQENIVVPFSYKLEAREEPGVLVLIDD